MFMQGSLVFDSREGYFDMWQAAFAHIDIIGPEETAREDPRHISDRLSAWRIDPCSTSTERRQTRSEEAARKRLWVQSPSFQSDLDHP